ncbi:hypothetical protein IWZ03DRAFT_92473 [Phyllosticta citriasiana]|uniref:Uncharacterized protein n=1 Tax=Phyllosticta citriasiana TaxID=595635 RepID=A0ABR1K7H4_9PEZI
MFAAKPPINQPPSQPANDQPNSQAGGPLSTPSVRPSVAAAVQFLRTALHSAQDVPFLRFYTANARARYGSGYAQAGTQRAQPCAIGYRGVGTLAVSRRAGRGWAGLDWTGAGWLAGLGWGALGWDGVGFVVGLAWRRLWRALGKLLVGWPATMWILMAVRCVAGAQDGNSVIGFICWASYAAVCGASVGVLEVGSWS